MTSKNERCGNCRYSNDKEARLREALRDLRDAANGVKYVALKPEIYTAGCTRQHAAALIAAIDSADAVLGEDGSSPNAGVDAAPKAVDGGM